MTDQKTTWEASRQYTDEQLTTAEAVLDEIRSGRDTLKAIRTHPLSKGGYIAKHTLVHVYREKVKAGELEEDDSLLARIRMKPVRSLSGVSTVTVLTEPYPCPGDCLFCPDDNQLPKSYLRDEPGAARAFQNAFDPYKQVRSRLDSYHAIGHPINKIELLILGGSWSAYPAEYRENFIKRCFDAMNGKVSPNLETAHEMNKKAESRNVGLVLETRPDMINPPEIASIRKFGATKVQMGAQSFDNVILDLNRRGHKVEDTLHATALLRAAGFKIVLHWMPNLLGSTPESDRTDFKKMWGGGFCPDEIKIYPTQLVREAPLFALWKERKYTPYSTQTLTDLIADIKPGIPIYSRVNRIVRDIPSHYIQAGSRRSSLRQDVHAEMERRGTRCRCIRCREIRGKAVDAKDLVFDDHIYQAAYAEEHFMNYSTPDDRLAGYLRLTIPQSTSDAAFNKDKDSLHALVPELKDAVLIREVHIYGQSLAVGSEQTGAAQHIGLGTDLLEKAEETARKAGYPKLVVISAVGTRRYYEKRGFIRSGLYMTKVIK